MTVSTLKIDDPERFAWDDTADVVVVGFGAAGACAALEADAAGASVILVDKFEGGGATALSGGVVYAGATRFQKEAGFDDTTDEMFKYLSLEVGGIVAPSLGIKILDVGIIAFFAFKYLSKPIAQAMADRSENVRRALDEATAGRYGAASLAELGAVDDDGDGVELVGVGQVGIPALHAAALEPDLFQSVKLVRTLQSWSSVIPNPRTQVSNAQVVYGALTTYDLPDLVSVLGAKLTVEQPVESTR